MRASHPAIAPNFAFTLLFTSLLSLALRTHMHSVSAGLMLMYCTHALTRSEYPDTHACFYLPLLLAHTLSCGLDELGEELLEVASAR